jgi:putative tryptophan/tyrosine transport system substrate-binding protein
MKRAAMPSILVAVTLLAVAVTAEAQQPKKVFRIGYIAGRSPSTDTDVKPIRLAMRQSGYIEGQNIVIEYRYTDGKSDRYPELLADLVRFKVDLILVAGTTRSGPP